MEENLDEFDYMIINVEYLLNGSLNSKVTVVEYPVSSTGITITYFGTALMSFSHDASIGANLFYINSTGYRLDAVEILSTTTASNEKITFTSVDLKTKTFKASWKGVGYCTSFIQIHKF